MKNKVICLTLCIVLLFSAVWGQKQGTNIPADTRSSTSDTRLNLQREIRLEANSKPEKVILDIDENVARFELVINITVTSGKLKIEVYDPKGNIQGTFLVGTQLNSEKLERVSGNINKSLKDPQSGSWKISIIPAEATGSITIQTSVFYRAFSAAK